jgi:hypothetical protein
MCHARMSLTDGSDFVAELGSSPPRNLVRTKEARMREDLQLAFAAKTRAVRNSGSTSIVWLLTAAVKTALCPAEISLYFVDEGLL